MRNETALGMATQRTHGEQRVRPASVGFLRWMKFNLVGAIGIGVQLAALALFTHALCLNYLLATALAVEAAVLHNFVWHERFTWSDRTSPDFARSMARLLHFNLTTGMISIAGNLVFMHLLVGYVGLAPLVANVTSIAGCSVLNFVVNDRVVFRKERFRRFRTCRRFRTAEKARFQRCVGRVGGFEA